MAGTDESCPECGSQTRMIDDPALPPNLGNRECISDSCWYVEEAVEL